MSWDLQPFRSTHLGGVIEVWNEAFAGGPNFIALTKDDFLGRVIQQPSFDPADFLVAVDAGRVVGFVHFGFRSNIWHRLRDRKLDPTEGQIYALAAAGGDSRAEEQLLDLAVSCLSQAGARRVLLGPNWVFGTQPFYNGIAGAYEIPGLSTSRASLLQVAEERGFSQVARCGTPELDLRDTEHLAALAEKREVLMEKARGWGLRERAAPLDSAFFGDRWAVLLARGFENVAMAAFGPWHEYQRERGCKMFGITSVQVAEPWRGRGLGKLVMMLAIEAAHKVGAEALHLHVWEANKAAWRLYHDALGFRPTFTWLTLAKELG